MGRLIDPAKRARAKEKRAERKQRILEVARSTLLRLPFVEVTLDGIGHAANVDRGVASLYFRSKEELFLRLLRDELAGWYAAVEAEIEDREGRLSKSDFAAVLAKSLSERHELTRFLSLESIVLEQNLDAMEVFRVQRWRRDRMAELDKLLERKVDGIRPGEGFRMLHLAQLLTAALIPAADPKGAAAYEIGDPDFAGFRVEFEPEMRRILGAILEAGPGS
ncbi:MAG: TetR family transcriptional regulator [Acidobacteria bacterium]|jgi:AcrR family transcriptional regulator|nr:TetR family transcriptional regulator [Acidobacteriota bacterium]